MASKDGLDVNQLKQEALQSIDRLAAQTAETDSDALRLQKASRLLINNGLHNLGPLLPMLLNLKGHPYTLEDHFPFEPFFNTYMAQNIVLKCGRQVSKSTSLAAQGVVTAGTIPFFNTLYVTPLYEMIRRFSNNYVRGFIDQSPVKNLWCSSSTSSNVLQRSFTNNSNMFFSFAFLDADRTRGLNCDKIGFDESIFCATLVDVPAGQVAIETLRPGDLVMSPDSKGHVKPRKVVSSSSHGIQRCYELTFSNGAKIKVTGNHPFPTSQWHKRLEQVVEDIVETIGRETNADGSGNHAGGRSLKCPKQKSEIPKQSRLESTQLQLPEGYPVIRVHSHSAKEVQEQRLGRMVESILDTNLAGLLPYRFFVSEGWKESSDQGVAGSTNVGRRRLVVHGRRRLDWKSGSLQHARIHHRRSRSASRLAERARCRMLGLRRNQPTHGQEVLGNPRFCERNVLSSGQDQVVDLRRDDLQTEFAGKTNRRDVQLVRRRICASQQSKQIRTSCQGLLPVRGMPSSESTNQRSKIQLGKSRGDQSQIVGTVLCRPRKVERVSSDQSGRMDRTKSRRTQCSTSTKPSQDCCGTTATSGDVRNLSQHVYDRSPGESTLLLARMQEPGQASESEKIPTKIVEAELVSIRYVGELPTWDIEVEETHMFIAAGVVSTNCQDLDSEFIPIIRETMSAS